jgi:hypothetical protein
MANEADSNQTEEFAASAIADADRAARVAFLNDTIAKAQHYKARAHYLVYMAADGAGKAKNFGRLKQAYDAFKEAIRLSPRRPWKPEWCKEGTWCVWEECLAAGKSAGQRELEHLADAIDWGQYFVREGGEDVSQKDRGEVMTYSIEAIVLSTVLAARSEDPAEATPQQTTSNVSRSIGWLEDLLRAPKSAVFLESAPDEKAKLSHAVDKLRQLLDQPQFKLVPDRNRKLEILDAARQKLGNP